MNISSGFQDCFFIIIHLKSLYFEGFQAELCLSSLWWALELKDPPKFQWVLPPREQTQGIKRSLILMFGNVVQKISSPFACAFLGVIQSSALLSLSSWKQCEVKSRCLFFKPG